VILDPKFLFRKYAEMLPNSVNDISNFVTKIKCPHGQLRWRWGMAKLAYCDC